MITIHFNRATSKWDVFRGDRVLASYGNCQSAHARAKEETDRQHAKEHAQRLLDIGRM